MRFSLHIFPRKRTLLGFLWSFLVCWNNIIWFPNNFNFFFVFINYQLHDDLLAGTCKYHNKNRIWEDGCMIRFFSSVLHLYFLFIRWTENTLYWSVSLLWFSTLLIYQSTSCLEFPTIKYIWNVANKPFTDATHLWFFNILCY